MAADLISFDDALASLAELSPMPGGEEVPLSAAAGRVLADAILARFHAPRHPIAMRDGYALRAADASGDVPLAIVGRVQAGGAAGARISAGQAMRIFTGAVMPDGADHVIMQEYAQVDGHEVRFLPGHGPAHHVRPAGSDFRAGDVLLAAGTRITPRALVTAAAADVATLMVAPRPRVAIIATGDELAEPGTAHLRTMAIPDSVSFAVAALAEEAGGHIVGRQVAGDDLPMLEQIAGQAMGQADVLVVCGGASVGEQDFGKAMFARHGLDLRFSGVAMMPGRPVWFGRVGRTHILGLPGNPTSAMVTARLFLVPLLAVLQGRPMASVLDWRTLPLAAEIANTGPRETFLRARWTTEGLLPASNQDSGMQAVLAQSDWLIRRSPGAAAAAAGEMVSAIPF